MIDFVNPHVRSYQEYVPGEQSRKKIIKLNANENHLPPHPGIKAYLKKFSPLHLRHYPDPHCHDLEAVVRKSYGLKKNVGLVFGNGADEIIRGIFKTFFTPHRDSVLLTEVTYPGYKTYADLEGVDQEYLPVNPDLSVSFAGLKKIRSRVFLLTNPNNPTGMSVKPKIILEWARSYPHKLFIIDEAYSDFSGESCLDLLPQNNLFVIKTLSKSFSACGLRLGFGVGTLDHVHSIRKVLDPYNLSILTMELGKIILSDLDYMNSNVKKVVDIREWLSAQLLKWGFEVFPSQANFLLVKPPKKNGNKSVAGDLFVFLKKKNIYVRYFDRPILADCLRITLGSRGDLKQLILAIKKFYGWIK